MVVPIAIGLSTHLVAFCLSIRLRFLLVGIWNQSGFVFAFRTWSLHYVVVPFGLSTHPSCFFVLAVLLRVFLDPTVLNMDSTLHWSAVMPPVMLSFFLPTSSFAELILDLLFSKVSAGHSHWSFFSFLPGRTRLVLLV